MKVVLYIAQSINGIIATEKYKEDFLSDINWREFKRLAEKINCVVIGRKTYETVKKWEDYNFDNVKAKIIVITTKNLNLIANKKYLLARSPREALRKAKTQGFNEVLLAGGGKTNSSFMKEKLVDEIIINVEPYVLGKGVSIFSNERFAQRLKLIDTKKLNHGVIQLNYKITR